MPSSSSTSSISDFTVIVSSHFSVSGVEWSSKWLLPSSIFSEEMLQEGEEEEVKGEVDDDDFFAKKQRGIFNCLFCLEMMAMIGRRFWRLDRKYNEYNNSNFQSNYTFVITYIVNEYYVKLFNSRCVCLFLMSK